jgi:hypothetical protein
VADCLPKLRVSGWREEFRGEDKAQHAQGRCRGVARDMPQVDAKVGLRVQPVSEARTKKVMVAKRAKERDDKKKKRPKTTSRSDKQKKSEKIGPRGPRADPTAFLTGPWGCPLDHR